MCKNFQGQFWMFCTLAALALGPKTAFPKPYIFRKSDIIFTSL